MLYLYSALILLYTINVFAVSRTLECIVGILSILSLALSFQRADRLYKSTGSVFMIVGLLLYMDSGLSWTKLPYFMNSTIILLVIFYVLPFINSIIVVGRYDQSVNKLLKIRTDHLGQLYYRGSLVSFLLGSFLNIATIPFVEAVLRKNLQSITVKLRHLFISQVMLRGYALSLAWSPMEILVAISVDITQISYLQYLPWLLLFSFVLLLFDWALGFRYRKYQLQLDEEKQAAALNMATVRRIFALLVYLSLFIAAVVGVRSLLAISFLLAVALVIVPYSIIWALIIRRGHTFIMYSLAQWKIRASSMQSYVVLFLAVGFFISILREAHYLEHIQEPFSSLADVPLLLFAAIQGLFIGLAMIGFHPLVTMSILGEVVQPLLGQINPISIGIVLITSGLSTVMAGPYNLTVSLTSSLLGENPYRISLWNIGFAFLYSSIGTFIAFILL